MEFYLIWISVSPTPFKYYEIYECFRSEIGMRLWPNVVGTAERERLLASVAGSSEPSVLNFNCQRMFKKPLVVGRRGYRLTDREIYLFIYLLAMRKNTIYKLL